MRSLFVPLFATLSFAQSLSFPFPGITPRVASVPLPAISNTGATSANFYVGQSAASMRIEQGFTTTGALSVPKIDLLMSRNSTSTTAEHPTQDDVYVDLYTDVADKPGALIQTSAVLPGTGFTAVITGAVVTATFSPRVSLLAGTKYHIVIRRTVETADGTNYFKARYAAGNAYAGGGNGSWNTATWSTESATSDIYFVVYTQ